MMVMSVSQLLSNIPKCRQCGGGIVKHSHISANYSGWLVDLLLPVWVDTVQWSQPQCTSGLLQQGETSTTGGQQKQSF